MKAAAASELAAVVIFLITGMAFEFFFQISYIPTKWNRQIRPWQGMLQMSAYRLNRLYKWGFHRFDLTKAYKVICWIDFLLYYSSLTLANDFKMKLKSELVDKWFNGRLESILGWCGMLLFCTVQFMHSSLAKVTLKKQTCFLAKKFVAISWQESKTRRFAKKHVWANFKPSATKRMKIQTPGFRFCFRFSYTLSFGSIVATQMLLDDGRSRAL